MTKGGMTHEFVEELQSLDVNDVGRWPFVVPRRRYRAIVFVVVRGIRHLLHDLEGQVLPRLSEPSRRRKKR